MKPTQRAALCIGRVLLSGIFLFSGYMQLNAWNATTDLMESEGIVRVDVLLSAAVLVEMVGGLMLLLGLRARFAAAALIVFLVPVTLIFHDFWTYSGPEQQMQMIQFLKNLAILGGLFAVLASGSGCCSLDARRERRAKQ